MLTIMSALSQVMVTLSPPVSPKVVARILMIQKPSVTAGTLVAAASLSDGVEVMDGLLIAFTRFCLGE